jgi:large subunit ribosomal protein L25
MAERMNISAEPRQVIGKQVKQLRRSGWIPAVIYGQGDPVHIQLENLALRRVLRSAGASNLIEIKLDIGNRTVLARQIQKHPYRDELLHVDFLEVNLREKISAEAELSATGEAAPVSEGLGTVTLLIHSVEIEALPDNLVAEIPVDFSRIQTPDDMIQVRDLETPAGVTILTDPDTVVARFEYVRAEEEEAAEELEGSAEVEVIGKGKKEEEDIEG